MIRRRLLRGAASNLAGKVAAVAASFLLTPFLVHALGADGYGLWVLVGSAFAYGALLDLGIGGAVVKYVAEHLARGETAGANAIVATAQRLFLLLGVLVAAVGFAAAPVVPRLFDVPDALRPVVAPLVVLTALNIGATIALLPTAVVLQGLQRYDLYNLVGVAGTVASAAGMALAVLAGGGLVGMACVALLVTAATRWAYLRLVRRTAPALRFGGRHASRSAARRLLMFGTASLAYRLGSRLSSRSDEFVIAAFLPVAAVAPYAVARKLSEAAQLVADQFLKVLVPLASELDAVGDRERLRVLYLDGSRLTLGIVVPAAVLLMRFGAVALTAWVGPDYADAAGLVTLLSLACLIETSQWAAGAVLEGMARQRLLAATYLGSGVLNVGLSILLVRPLGLAGVAWGTLIAAAIASLGVILPHAVRTLGIAPETVVRDVWLPGLLPALPMSFALAAVESVLAPPAAPAPVAATLAPVSPAIAAAASAAGLLAYAAAYLAMPGARAERRAVVRLVRVMRGARRRSHAAAGPPPAGERPSGRAAYGNPPADG
ncbi:MAG TPA: oligosaccharide flippase family protein [Longimicrobiales bacterium]